MRTEPFQDGLRRRNGGGGILPVANSEVGFGEPEIGPGQLPWDREAFESGSRLGEKSDGRLGFAVGEGPGATVWAGWSETCSTQNAVLRSGGVVVAASGAVKDVQV
jgi:hypothetical protein